MGHQQAYRAAAVGKLRGNNTLCGNKARRPRAMLAVLKGLVFGAAAVMLAAVSSTAGYAQSGPFNGLAGVWAGTGTVTLDDGSSERIRCRATYAVGEAGKGLNQSLTCASDSYKFDFKTNIVAAGEAVTGTWSESSRGINGTIQGRGTNGNLQVTASSAGFTANIAVTTHGNRQSVVIRSESQFKGANITMTRS